MVMLRTCEGMIASVFQQLLSKRARKVQNLLQMMKW